MSETLHIVSILDRSGSMSGTEKEVIGAYNAFAAEQLKITIDNNIESTMTLVLFDNEYEEVYFKLPIAEVPELTSSVYYTRGMTALYDAIGKTIAKFDKESKVIFFIETDGAENASREFSGSTLKDIINKKKADGWDFNFVVADLDYSTTSSMGASMGIDSSKIANFSKSSMGYATRNTVFSNATSMYINNSLKAEEDTPVV